MKKLIIAVGATAIVSAGAAAGITAAATHSKTKTVVEIKEIEKPIEVHQNYEQAAKAADYTTINAVIKEYMLNDNSIKNYDFGVSQNEPNVEKTFQTFMAKVFGRLDFFDSSEKSFANQMDVISDDWSSEIFKEKNVKDGLLKSIPTIFWDKFVSLRSKMAGLVEPYQTNFYAMQLIVKDMTIDQVKQYMNNILDTITNSLVSLLTSDMPNLYTAYGYKQPTNAAEFLAWLSRWQTEHPRDFEREWKKIDLTLPTMDVVNDYVRHNELNLKYKSFEEFKANVIKADFSELKNIASSIPFFANLYSEMSKINDSNVDSKITTIVGLDHEGSKNSVQTSNYPAKAKQLYDKWYDTFMKYHRLGINDPATTNMMAMLFQFSSPMIPYGAMVNSFAHEDMYLLNDYITKDATQRQKSSLSASDNHYDTYTYMDDKWDEYFSKMPYDRLKTTLQNLTRNLGLLIKDRVSSVAHDEPDPVARYRQQLIERGNDPVLLFGEGHFNFNQFD